MTKTKAWKSNKRVKCSWLKEADAWTWVTFLPWWDVLVRYGQIAFKILSNEKNAVSISLLLYGNLVHLSASDAFQSFFVLLLKFSWNKSPLLHFKMSCETKREKFIFYIYGFMMASVTFCKPIVSIHAAAWNHFTARAAASLVERGRNKPKCPVSSPHILLLLLLTKREHQGLALTCTWGSCAVCQVDVENAKWS